MRIINTLTFIIGLLFICANAEKVKRQVNLGFLNQGRPINIGQFLGGLLGGNNQNQNPLGGLFDTLSGLSNGNNQNSGNQNQFRPLDIGIDFLGSFGSQGCSVNNGGCQQGCRVIQGMKQCYCRVGFHLHIQDGSCHDDNECRQFRPCEDRCENTVGSYQCFCSQGTLQPDGTCRAGGFVISGGFTGISGGQDGHIIQSCRNQNGGCEQICLQQRNGVQCQCQPGYTQSPQNPNSCIDVDECATGSHVCQNHCVNTVGSYSCQGISFPTATSITCANNNGGCEYRCRDTRNGVHCGCRENFVLHSNQKSCVCPIGFTHEGNQCTGNRKRKINCSKENGGCQQRCRTPRRGRHRCVCNLLNFELQKDKKSCACKEDFILSVDGKSCIDEKSASLIGSCEVDNGGCQQKCKTLTDRNKCACRKHFKIQEDGRSCLCKKGFYLSPDGRKCLEPPPVSGPIDPCIVNKGGCHHNCKAVGLQPECYCNDGYSLAPDAISCIPKDGCTFMNGGCSHICTNKNGKAVCTCQPGWNLGTNSRTCIEITTVTTARPRTGCGVNNKKDLLRRIVGGKPADPKDWPWMAAILRKRNQDQFCGGVLITDRHILTASHCLVDFKKEDVLVRLGEYDFSSTTENSPTDFAVVEIRVHENYNRSSQENDIALMKLDSPSTFSEFIWPVCLPPPDQQFMNQLGYVTGWGTTSFGGTVSRILQEVVIPVWAQSDCGSAYPNKIISTMMCAGLREGGKDSCQGDSGGPFLVQIYPSSRWFVIGVVSWGIKCAEAGNPGVYTRVNEFLPWIRSNAIF